MPYHVDDPLAAIREAFRVLRPGGLLAVSATSRNDSPELAHLLDRRPSTFDAEDAPAAVNAYFSEPGAARNV